MATRLSIPKLAGAAISPLNVPAEFRSPSGVRWIGDVNYLRDIYMSVYSLWNSSDGFKHQTDAEGTRSVSEVKYDPAGDKTLYGETEAKLRELLLGMEGISRQLTTRRDIYSAVQNATYDFNTAGTYSRTGDYALALVYQSYALIKIHKMLDGLTRAGNKLKDKKAYGFDTSGEVHEQGGTSGDQKNLWDTAQPQDGHMTPPNPANQMIDAEAENDFSEELAEKHERVIWPARTR